MNSREGSVIRGLDCASKRVFPMKRASVVGLLFLVAGGIGLAQYRFGNRERRGGGDEGFMTARAMPSHSTGTPTWENPPAFAKDVFTFARIRYASGYGGYYRGGG